jgi:aminopeptidase N
MRTFLLLSSLLFAMAMQAQLRPIDVQHYRFELGLSDSTDLITGVATIKFKPNKRLDTVSVDLADTARRKGMEVLQVLADGKPANWVRRNNKLHVIWAMPGFVEKELVVRYQGVPADGLIIAKNKFGDRTFFGDNWPNRARNWLPCVDDPADKASVEFLVTAPLHYQVVSNGVQVEETVLNDAQKLTHWKETVPLATKIMVIGVSKFAVQYVGDTLGVPVYSWVYPQEKENAFYDYAQAKEILPFFINNVAPYAYRKLANVQSKTIFGGMENAGCIFYAEGIVSGRRLAEDLLAHEIAHQWFGNMATEKSFAHLWLSEGFATYMTDLYMASRYGQDTMNKRLSDERAQVIAFNGQVQRAVVDSPTTNYMQLLNANSYQKGAWVLHMLRDEVGAEKFMQAVRAYYKKYAGGNASTDDFRKVVEEISGKNFEAFFRQWLFTPGLPVLKVSHVYDAKKDQLQLTVTQVQMKAFTFPLEIELQTAKGPVRKTFMLNEREHRFTVPATGAVSGLRLDPDVKLLFEQVR